MRLYYGFGWVRFGVLDLAFSRASIVGIKQLLVSILLVSRAEVMIDRDSWGC